MCKERYLEQIEGDLYELFERDRSGSRFAWNTLRFMRRRYLKGIDDFEQLTTLAMLKNYLLVALRSLSRQKSYTLINLVGLSVAIASTMLISIYIGHERNYDDFHKDGDRLYKITKREHGKWTPPLLAHTIREEIPQFETATKTTGTGEGVIMLNDQPVKQEGGVWADQHFFDVFEVEFVAGDRESALDQPDHVVLTQEVAEKFFPGQSAMSQRLEIEGESYLVAGIIPNTARNTHFPFKYVVADHLDLEAEYYWTGGSGQTYAKLAPNVDIEDAELALEELYTKYAGPELIGYSGHTTFEEYKKAFPEEVNRYVPHPIASIHLEKPNLSNGNAGSKESIQIFFFISLFILIVASINYINMSTARSTLRSKEVGIRKTLGSSKRNVIFQFLTEALLITFFASLVAFIIGFLTLDLFNSITLREFLPSDLFSIQNLLTTLAIILVVGIAAGAYPAFIISKFNPIVALKGGLKLKGKSMIRNSLVSFQFATSIFLLVATLIIYLQVDHLQSRELGIDIEETLVVQNAIQLDQKYEAFKRQLLASRHIKEVAKSSHVPFMGYPNYGYVIGESNEPINPNNFFVEPGFEDVLDVQLVSGRFFKPNTLSDTSKVIINEALAKEVGWRNPLGEILRRDELLYEVVGVVKDFNYRSLKGDIDPMILRYAADVWDVGMWHQRNVLIRYEGDQVKEMVADVESAWRSFVPDYPFDAVFLDDTFSNLYEEERRFGKTFTTFSCLAILIAFLGLFSLTTFVLQRRVKEIAVRKVMGASVSSVLRLMIREFTWLVVFGGIIGIVGSFYWLSQWLEGYSYRIEISWYHLVTPMVVIIATTWLIVSAKSYAAAISNPSLALKDE